MTRKANFTLEEDLFIKENYRDLFDDEISVVLNRPAGSITRRRQRLGCWYVQQELTAPIKGEIWVQIKGLPKGYQVSNMGRVKSGNKLVSLYLNKKGYVQWRLVNDSKGIRANYKVHRLVAEHFLDRPDNTDEYDVHHLDHNRSNNTQENLQWLTKADHIKLHTT